MVIPLFFNPDLEPFNCDVRTRIHTPDVIMTTCAKSYGYKKGEKSAGACSGRGIKDNVRSDVRGSNGYSDLHPSPG